MFEVDAHVNCKIVKRVVDTITSRLKTFVYHVLKLMCIETETCEEFD